MNEERLNDWIAICAIKGLIERYKTGRETDYTALLGIKEILIHLGFIAREQDDNYCGHDYKHMDHGTASYFKCLKCGAVR
jgi:hypothetical protein